MKTLCTMPGKFGDLLWALPTVRALSVAASAPVDLLTSAQYASLCPLIEQQPYMHRTWGDASWSVRDTAPMTPSQPEHPATQDLYAQYDRVIHLGYTRWPQRMLAVEIYQQATRQWGEELPTLDLDVPWITCVPPVQQIYPSQIAVGFSDEWFELKVGLTTLLAEHVKAAWLVLIPPRSRWLAEYTSETTYTVELLGWVDTAARMAEGTCFLGCLSSQWVLANALGLRTVIMEPNEMRWNSIFWHDHPRNLLVTGTDGRPTFDARHVRDAITQQLAVAEQQKEQLA